jgi:FAD:protein FMN transferase
MIFSRGTENPRLVVSGPAMGTSYTIQVVLGRKISSIRYDALQVKLTRDIGKIIDGIVERMSVRSPASEIYRFNHFQGNGWFPVSADTARVVSHALKISERSGGAFDITMGPLIAIWGFRAEQKSGIIPADSEIEEALRRVGYRNLRARIFPPALKKENPGICCDLSAIAKGFAVDRVAEYLESIGYRRYLVEIGGEIRSRGKNHLRQAWTVGIEMPDSDGMGILKAVRLGKNAVATSGDTHIYFEKGGTRYAHTIDPATGRPLSHNLASVSVIHSSCMEADALATAILVLGPEKGYEFALESKRPALLVIRLENGLSEKMTASFRRYLAE